MKKNEVAIYLKMVNRLGPKIREAEANLGGFRRRTTQDFKRWGAILALTISTALGASVATGAQFEQSLANVGAVARATAGEMQALESRARALGSTTAYTASNATEAMYSLSSGGLDVKQTIATTEPVLKLAGATLTDMGSAAELTMSSMRQFGLEAQDSTKIVNVFAAGIQNSMLTMGRLTESMTYAGPVAASLGMSIEQTTAALALLHNAGLKGSLAGTGLRMTLIRLIKPSEDLQKALGGISVERDGLAAVLGKLQSLNLSGQQMAEMFGPRAYGAIKALTDAGAEGFEEMTKKLTGTQAAYEMYRRQMATTSGRMKIFKSAMQENMLSTFEAIQPVVDKAITAITEFVKNAKPALVGFAVKARKAFFRLWKMSERAFGYLRDNSGVLKSVAAGFTVATASVYAFSVALGLANTVMATTPVGWLAIGFAALIGGMTILIDRTIGLTQWWIGLTTAFRTGGAYARAAFAGIGNELATFTASLFAVGASAQIILTGTWNIIREFIGNSGRAFSTLSKMIAQPWNAGRIWEDAKASLSAGLEESMGGIKDEVGALWDEIEEKNRTGSRIVALNLFNDLENIRRDAVNALRGVEGGQGKPFEVLQAEFEVMVAKFKLQIGALNHIFTGLSFQRDGSGTNAKLARVHREMSKEMIESARRYAAATMGIPFFGDAGSQKQIAMAQRIAAATGTAMDVIKSSAVTAMRGMTDAIAGAVVYGENLLESLGDVAKNVFFQIVQGFAMLGLKKAFPVLALLPGFAAGGYMAAGTTAIVGERGPEIIQVGAPSYVTPNSVAFGGGSKSVGSAGGGDTNITVHTTYQFPSNSIMFADNKLAMRRLFEEGAKITTDKISRTVRRRTNG